MTKLLARIIGTKRFKRLALWYYRTFKAGESFVNHPVYKAMVLIRAAEATVHADIVLGIDSVIHGGEDFFEEKLSGCRVVAISGDTTEGFLARIGINVEPYKPKTVILHAGGNDVLNGVEMDIIVENLRKIHDRLKSIGVKRIAYLEIPPLAEKAEKAHEVSGELNQIVKTQLPFDYLETRKKLSGPDGFIAERYRGDPIHPNALAYNEVFFPVIAKYVRGAP